MEYKTNIILESGVARRQGSFPDGENYDFTYSPPLPTISTKVLQDTKVTESTFKPDDRNVSFKKLVRSGLIKMTPMSQARTTTTDHLITLDQYSAVVSTPWSGTNYAQPLVHWASWLECWQFSDLIQWNSLSAPPVNLAPRSENSVKSALISAAQSSLDALTTAAEGKEAINLIVDALKAIRKPIATYKAAVSGIKDPKALASAWLQFRYGVMPLVMTVKDGIDLLDKRGDIFKTDRAQESDTTKENYYDGPYNHIYAVDDISIHLRGTSKARFSSVSLRLADQINVNPFLTGWELITLSFVIDWFLNVGDVIQAYTMSLFDMAEQRVNCMSVKTNGRRVLYLHRIERPKVVEKRHPVTGELLHFERNYSVLGPCKLRTIEYDNYSRYLFSPDDVHLEWNPKLNWKRWADALALSITNSQQALRLLRKLT